MTRSLPSLAFAVLLSLAGACQSAAEALTEAAAEAATGQEIDVDEGTVTIKGEEGTVVVRGDEKGTFSITSDKGSVHASQKVPADFPLPVIDGAEIATATRMEKPGGKLVFAVMFKTDKPVKEVAAFYKKALEGQGIKTQTVDMGNGDRQAVTLMGNKGKKLQANVVASSEGDGADTDVMLACEMGQP